MKFSFLTLLLLSVTVSIGQGHKPVLVKAYWDFNSTILQSEGYYFADDFYGETTLKHGRWLFWDRAGNLEEEQNYFIGKLHGTVITYYPTGKKKEQGFPLLSGLGHSNTI